jgi:hypothetical protein
MAKAKNNNSAKGENWDLFFSAESKELPFTEEDMLKARAQRQMDEEMLEGQIYTIDMFD